MNEIYIYVDFDKSVDFLIERYESGAFGTFEKPRRNASCYAIFWSVALGHRNAEEYRGAVDYCFAKAGKIVKESLKTS